MEVGDGSWQVAVGDVSWQVAVVMGPNWGVNAHLQGKTENCDRVEGKKDTRCFFFFLFLLYHILYLIVLQYKL